MSKYVIHYFIAAVINMGIYMLAVFICSMLFGSGDGIDRVVIIAGIISSLLLAIYHTRRHFSSAHLKERSPQCCQ